MQLTTLALHNYRNIEDLTVGFSPGCTIIYGENGQGKTNILESIYLCAYGRSHKNSKERELILKEQDEAHIRGEFSSTLTNQRVDIHDQISGGREKLRIVYEPSSEEEILYENILKNRERDRIYRQTHTGPHRDDLSFYDDKTDLKIFGSSGQQRSCALSLKLAQICMIEKQKKERPVLLLDDVMSELDRNRQKQLVKSLHNIQTIITCTGMDEFIEEQMDDVRRIHIRSGRIID